MDNLDQYTDEALIDMYLRWLKGEMETWERDKIMPLLQCSGASGRYGKEARDKLIELYLDYVKGEMKARDRRNIMMALRSSVIMTGNDLPVSQHINTQ